MTGVVALLLLTGAASWITVVAALPASAVTCTIQVGPNDDIQSDLDAYHNAHPTDPPAVFCLASSTTYRTPTTIVPYKNSTIITVNTPYATIGCSNIPHTDIASTDPCVDLVNSTDVTLKQLTVKNAPAQDINLGVRSTVDTVSIQCAGDIGITADQLSSDSTVVNSTFQYNPASEAVAISQQNCPSQNPPPFTCQQFDPDGKEGHCAGLKSSNSQGLTVQGNTFTDNGGGGALWFDASSRGSSVNPTFDVLGNTVTSNDLVDGTDGIRLEISCNASVTGNTVNGNSGTEIDLVNSNHITVGGNGGNGPNIVKTGSLKGIRILGDGRWSNGDSSDIGNGSCAQPIGDPHGSAWYFHAEDNNVINNDITVGTGGQNGNVNLSGQQSQWGPNPDGKFVRRDVWTSNDYTLKNSQNCKSAANGGTTAWLLPNPPNFTNASQVTWPDWKAAGQDNTTGQSCTAV
jgi:hypothetical protein